VGLLQCPVGSFQLSFPPGSNLQLGPLIVGQWLQQNTIKLEIGLWSWSSVWPCIPATWPKFCVFAKADGSQHWSTSSSDVVLCWRPHWSCPGTWRTYGKRMANVWHRHGKRMATQEREVNSWCGDCNRRYWRRNCAWRERFHGENETMTICGTKRTCSRVVDA